MDQDDLTKLAEKIKKSEAMQAGKDAFYAKAGNLMSEFNGLLEDLNKTLEAEKK